MSNVKAGELRVELDGTVLFAEITVGDEVRVERDIKFANALGQTRSFTMGADPARFDPLSQRIVVEGVLPQLFIRSAAPPSREELERQLAAAHERIAELERR